MFLIHGKRNRRMQCSVEFKPRPGRSRRRQTLSLVFRRSWPFGIVRSILRGVPADMDLEEDQVVTVRCQRITSQKRLSMIIVIMMKASWCKYVRFGKSSWPPHVSKFRIESSQLLLGSLQSRFQSYNSPLRPKLRVSLRLITSIHTTLPTSLNHRPQ